MTKKPVLLGIAFALIVLGVLVYSSMNLSQHRVEVCITYNGRQACATDLGATREAAMRAATTSACAQISSGVTGSIGCENTKPDKITWLK
jgi:hypothetical protein